MSYTSVVVMLRKMGISIVEYCEICRSSPIICLLYISMLVFIKAVNKKLWYMHELQYLC